MSRSPRRLLPVLLAAVLVPALTAAAASARVPSSYVGVLASDIDVYNLQPDAWNADFAAMHRAGIGTYRASLDAAAPRTTLDTFVLDAAKHRIHVFPTLIDSSGYHPEQGPQHGFHPPKPAKLAAYARYLVKRYGPRGTLWRGTNRRYRAYAMRTWQIWNEPNLVVWWKPKPRPAAYVRMLKAASRAIRRHDRHARIVSAGIPDSTQSKPLDYRRYLKAFLRDGGWRYIDAIGVHAYSPTVRGVARILKTYRKLLNAHHGRRVGMLISEVGWADTGHRNPMVVGRRGQAARIRGLFRLVRRLRKPYRIGGVFYFQWKDYQALPGDPKGNTWGYHTGLLKADGRKKLAYRAFRRGVRRLR